MTERKLIVNADDFGQSGGINRGTIDAHEKGIVTSASLMVRWPAATEAAYYGRTHPDFSIGLHVDLAEWIHRNGAWTTLYEVIKTQDAVAVRDEIHRQLDTFRRLVDREPTHIDSHQHVHRAEPAHSIILGLAHDLGVPCRGYSPVQYCGSFYGQTATGVPHPQAISTRALIQLLIELPSGITELGCHPAVGVDLNSMYIREREQELAVLCDMRVHETIRREKIMLCSFNEWRAAGTVSERLSQ